MDKRRLRNGWIEYNDMSDEINELFMKYEAIAEAKAKNLYELLAMKAKIDTVKVKYMMGEIKSIQHIEQLLSLYLGFNANR